MRSVLPRLTCGDNYFKSPSESQNVIYYLLSLLFVLFFTAVSFLNKQLLINNVVSWPFVWLEKTTIWGQQHMSHFFSWLINLILINWNLHNITHPFPVLLFSRIRLCLNTSQKHKNVIHLFALTSGSQPVCNELLIFLGIILDPSLPLCVIPCYLSVSHLPKYVLNFKIFKM